MFTLHGNKNEIGVGNGMGTIGYNESGPIPGPDAVCIIYSKPLFLGPVPGLAPGPGPVQCERTIKATKRPAMPTFGGGNKCGVCGKSVYFNEERKAAGKSFHVSCFRCCT